MGGGYDKGRSLPHLERVGDIIMAKYTERLDIKMTKEDMCLLATASLKAGKPLTVYARELILNQINPMMMANGVRDK